MNSMPEPAQIDTQINDSADSLAVTALSALITIGMIDKDSADALLSLWRRRDRLTPVELDAIRAAAVEPRDDGGFSERYLAEMRAARAEDPGATCDRCGEVAPADPDIPCPHCA